MAQKNRLRRIDDPFDAADAAYPKRDENIPVDLALQIGAHAPLLQHLIGPIKEARDFLSKRATNERLEALTAAVNEKTEALAGQVAEIKSRVETPSFAAAFREASVQTLFATEHAKIKRFGAVLGNSLGATYWPEIAGDLTSFIKALAQLGERDIAALRLLNTLFSDVVKVYPNMHDPNPFTEKAQDLLKAAGEWGFHRDDFYAHCRRLEGFGLAMEVPRNTSRMSPGDYCFRPTRLGLKLSGLLQNGPSQSSQASTTVSPT